VEQRLYGGQSAQETLNLQENETSLCFLQTLTPRMENLTDLEEKPQYQEQHQRLLC